MHARLAHRRGRLAAILVFALTAAMCLASAPFAAGSFPGRNGLLAVGGSGFDFGCANLTIHVMRSDGSGVRPLTPSGKCATSAHQRWAPDWSADGTRLLFMDFTESLGVMSTDGADVGRLRWAESSTDWPGGAASFAPDGRRAVADVLGLRSRDLWIAALDGSPPRRIHRGTYPRWSPDGRMIAYATEDGRLGILDVDTGRPTMVRRFSRRVISVDWSPDGRRLLMVMSSSAGANSLAAVVALDATSRPVRFALPRRFSSRWLVTQAVWSPNGRRIAFVGYRDYNDDSSRPSLWVMSARGGRFRPLIRRGSLTATYDSIEATVSWQPIAP